MSRLPNILYTGTTPCITVTSPGGGQNWKVGSTRTISWTPSNLNSNAKITLYYYVGSTLRTIVSGLPRYSSSYNWTVPNTPTTSARIRVVSTVNTIPECSGVSNLFTINT